MGEELPVDKNQIDKEELKRCSNDPTSSIQLKINKDYRSLWSYIPHFVHTPFYVYAYAFGDCLVNSLWSEYESSNKNKFSKLYINLLSSGGTKRHDELLKPFGLSARDNEFWKNGLNSITNMIKDLENITNE